MAAAQLPLRKRGPHPGTGDFIKDYLQRLGEDYIYHTYKMFCKFLRENGQQGPSYESFRKYFGVCAQMNLVEFVREELPKPGKQHLFARRYFRVVQRNIKSRAWRNPQAALDTREGRMLPDPVSGELVPVTRLGKRRYRRWRQGSPPKPVGRPRGSIKENPKQNWS